MANLHSLQFLHQRCIHHHVQSVRFIAQHTLRASADDHAAPCFACLFNHTSGELLQRIAIDSGIRNSSHVDLRASVTESGQHSFPPSHALLIRHFCPLTINLPHGGHAFDNLLIQELPTQQLRYPASNFSSAAAILSCDGHNVEHGSLPQYRTLPELALFAHFDEFKLHNDVRPNPSS